MEWTVCASIAAIGQGLLVAYEDLAFLLTWNPS